MKGSKQVSHSGKWKVSDDMKEGPTLSSMDRRGSMQRLFRQTVDGTCSERLSKGVNEPSHATVISLP
jgi:hypothetical protein